MSGQIHSEWPDTAQHRRRAFQQVWAVLGGHRVPPDAASRKTLTILLRCEGGCDAKITSGGFEVMPENGLRPQEFHSQTAPGVVSELLRLAGVAEPVDAVRAHVGPGVIACGDMVPGCEFGRKVLWLDVNPVRVVFHLRAASGSDERDLAERPEPYRGFLVPALCPYCAELLRTPRAKQCRFCKRNWHDPNHVKWLDGREA